MSQTSAGGSPLRPPAPAAYRFYEFDPWFNRCFPKFFALTRAGIAVTFPPRRGRHGQARCRRRNRNIFDFPEPSISPDMESRAMTTAKTAENAPVHPWSLWAACFVGGCVALAILGTGGCSVGGTGASSAAAEPAKAAVVTFLEAIKRGDDTAACGMLTKVARVKTQELGISVAPPVNPTATYAIRECEMVGDAGDLVHVGTTWTDTDPDGFTSTDNVVWVVRLDPEGWRVVGMAMRIFEDLPPLLLNFEDPDDMIAKQEMVAAELQKRAQQASAKAAAEAPRTARGDTPAAK